MAKPKVDVSKMTRRRKEAKAEMDPVQTGDAAAVVKSPPPTPQETAPSSQEPITIVLDTSRDCQQRLIAELTRIKNQIAEADYEQEMAHDKYKALTAALLSNFIHSQEKMAEWKARNEIENNDQIIAIKAEHAKWRRELNRLRMEWDITLQKINLVSRLHQRELAELNMTGGK